MTDDKRPPIAFVTGGAIGIGRAVAIRLAADGFVVAIGYHHTPAEETVAGIVAGGGAATAINVDVTRRESVDAALVQVVEQMGGLDVLVNNAGGLLGRIGIEAMSDDHWDQVLALNLTSVFFCSRAAAAHMGQGGRIVNLSSQAAQGGGGPGAAAYAAAKAGVIGLTRAMAKELGPRGITVNAIAPGFIDDTPFHAAFSTPDAQRNMVAAAAVGRAGAPADVAAAVSYLASSAAGFVSGVVLDLNGGSYFT